MERSFGALVRRCTYLFGLILLLSSAPVSAQDQDSVTISTTVLSGVSAGTSTFVSDILQLPADGKSVVVLTATILSKENQPLPNKEVVVTSNRGETDSIFCYSGNTLTDKNSTITDSEGKARCVASSEVPGNATFTAVAEGVTLDDRPTVTFTPLPFLTNLTIKINLPRAGELTILEPSKPKVTAPSTQRLVNTDVELRIPFWVALMLILFFLTEPILIILVLRLSKKVRRGFEAEHKFEVQEKEYLGKIYQLEQQANVQQAAVMAKSDQIVGQIAATQNQLQTSLSQQSEIKNRLDQAAPPPVGTNAPPRGQ